MGTITACFEQHEALSTSVTLRSTPNVRRRAKAAAWSKSSTGLVLLGHHHSCTQLFNSTITNAFRSTDVQCCHFYTDRANSTIRASRRTKARGALFCHCNVFNTHLTLFGTCSVCKAELALCSPDTAELPLSSSDCGVLSRETSRLPSTELSFRRTTPIWFTQNTACSSPIVRAAPSSAEHDTCFESCPGGFYTKTLVPWWAIQPT